MHDTAVHKSSFVAYLRCDWPLHTRDVFFLSCFPVTNMAGSKRRVTEALHASRPLATESSLHLLVFRHNSSLPVILKITPDASDPHLLHVIHSAP